MVFSSSTFLFAFLPVTLIIYFLLRSRSARNVWLLVVSLCFYAWGEPVYVLLMVASILVNWGIAIGLGAQRQGEERTSLRRRAMLAVAVVFNVAVIGFFKYEGFLADNVNALVGSQIVPNMELPLPIGISFYTLQALSYVIDVYRGDVPPQRNILYLGMYIACFPQLIAGPIVRYSTIQDQILNRRETLERFHSGLRLFIVGLAKKVLLANVCAILADKMLAAGGAEVGLVGAWAGLIAYTFQILFDFSGYSDMAIGLGRMMGFEYLRNFNYPYIAKSVGEFWRRWHISLYTFFRDYIYIPLGGSRVSTGRWVLNTAVVWAITGLWHGAAWHYIAWGVYYGVLLICEKLLWGKALAKLPAPLRHLYTIVAFVFGWFIFWVPEAQMWEYLQALFGTFGLTGNSTMWELTAWEYWPVLIVCIAASTPLVPWAWGRVRAWAEGGQPSPVTAEGRTAHIKTIEARDLCSTQCQPASAGRARAVALIETLADIALLVLLVISIASVLAGTYNPFIYFQF
ncbi:MAG: MBOAT family O-acyltransferase [Coriobacteriales bacterium]